MVPGLLPRPAVVMPDIPADRTELLELIRRFASVEHAPEAFTPGETRVPVSGRTIDADDITTLVDAALDGWLTTGRYALEFEETLAAYLGRKHAILCNSGSSANLLALSALTSRKLGERRLRAGDEVITVAGGFPTTVNPIVQNGLVPVFVDLEPVERGTYNVDPAQLESAIGPKTRAIMLAHTLGNPFALDEVRRLARRHHLWFVEDNCDALGSEYDGRLTGTFGDLATFSFYPAHHITMGEGGCIVADRGRLKTLVESFRDWGRDCWCEPGDADTCGKRFGWQQGHLPKGYDHKYIFSHVGYNLKATDLQAATGVSQMKKLPSFIQSRRDNFDYLERALSDLDEHLILPQATAKSRPSWFGFPITVREEAAFDRPALVKYLDGCNIDTRMLFAGNLARQPAYQDRPFRTIAQLTETDRVMNGTFWLGVFPGLDRAMLDYVIDRVRAFCKDPRRAAKAGG